VSNPPRHLHAAGAGKDPLNASAALIAGLAAPFAGTVFDPADPVLAVFCAADSPSVLRTDGLPVPMQREICWWLAACHGSGERVIDTTDWRRWTATALDVIAGQPQVRSFADLALEEWMTAWVRKFHADHGRLPAAGSRQRAASALRGLLPRLAVRYSDEPWWKHDVWCLRFDPRIPRREHEPRGESSVRWDGIQPRWLRGGYTFWLHLQLESGQLTWSSAAPSHVFASRFSEFAVSRGLDHPALVSDPAGLRPLMLDFRVFLRQWKRRATGAKELGGPLDDRSVACTERVIGNFYRAMHDYKADVAAAVGDDRWLELTDAHARLYRPGEVFTERVIKQADERNYISDADLSKMLACIELLGMPRGQSMTITRDGRGTDVAGSGQPATMRAWLIQALTGRRASEILLMDFDPLSPVPGIDPAEVPDGGMVARLRYQQTKVDGAPMTILVGADVVQIIREQQDWVRQRWNLGPDGTARYLFPRLTGNRKATRAWETGHYDLMLRQFSDVAGLRDSDGRELSYSRATASATPRPRPSSMPAPRSTSSSAISGTGRRK
jgi:integrase